MPATRVGTIKETSNSPSFTYGKDIKGSQEFVGSLVECQAAVKLHNALGSGDWAGWIVDESTIVGIGGGNYRLTINYSAYSVGEMPADEYSVDPFEINPKLEKHPRYSTLTADLELQAVKQAVDGGEYKTRKEALDSITAKSAGVNWAKAKELAEKLMRGQDSYYLPGLKYVWATHHPTGAVPALSLGGVIETPDGPCAPYLPAGAAWLREADKLSWTGTVWKVTRTWVGAPAGHWDTDIYQS